MVFLSMVTPAKNEEKYLPLASDSIDEQSCKDDLERILADAGSTDRTIEIAEKRGWRIVKGGHPAIGRNNGARESHAGIICFMDSDMILPSSNYLETAVNEIEYRGLDVAGVLVTPVKTGKLFKDMLYRAFYEVSNIGLLLNQNSKKPFMQSLMFVRRRAFDKIGGFPLFEFGEDSALAEKAVANGYKFGILRSVPKALISPRRLESKGFLWMLGTYMYFNGGRMLGHEFELYKDRAKYFHEKDYDLKAA